MLPRLLEAGVFGSASLFPAPCSLPSSQGRGGETLWPRGSPSMVLPLSFTVRTIHPVAAGAVTCDSGAWQGDIGSSVSSEWARVPAGPACTSQSDLQQPQFPHLPTQDLDTIHLLDPCQLAHPDCDSDLALGFPRRESCWLSENLMLSWGKRELPLD